MPSKTVQIITSDPLKAQIVAVALQRLYAPSDFARDVGIALNVASYAFRVLRENDILELVKEERIKGATIKHLYRATEAALVSTANWGLLADELRPGIVGTTLHDFNARASQAQETGHMFLREDFCVYWAPADLDDIAWEEQTEFVNWFIEASKNLVVETANRRANGKSKGGFHATVAIAAFPSPTHEEVKKHKPKRGRGKGKSRGKAKGSHSGRAAKGKGGKK